MGEPLALRLPFGAAPVRPVAIIGFGKSGKSLLTGGLARSGLFTAYPTEGNKRLFLPGLYPWHATNVSVPPMWYDPAPTVELMKARYDERHSARVRYAVGGYQKLVGKTVILDNGNVAYWLDAYLRIFPDARVLTLIRDPRDAVPEVARNLVAKSARHSRFATEGYQLPLGQLVERLTSRWLDVRRVIANLERSGFTRVVRFEELRRRPRKTVSDVLTWLGHDDCHPQFAIDDRPSRPRDSEASRVEQVLAAQLTASERPMLAEDMALPD